MALFLHGVKTLSNISNLKCFDSCKMHFLILLSVYLPPIKGKSLCVALIFHQVLCCQVVMSSLTDVRLSFIGFNADLQSKISLLYRNPTQMDKSKSHIIILH